MKKRHGFYNGEIRGEIRGSDKSKVDTKGYMDITTQVKRMENAGFNLEAFRRQYFKDSQTLDEWTEPSPLDAPDLIPSVDFPAAEAELKRVLDSRKVNAQSETKQEPAENIDKKDNVTESVTIS